MLIFQLMIAHLLGDFVFQSNALVKKKYEHWTGTLEHVLIITLLNVLVLFPYLGTARAWAVIGCILTFHFIQDALKVEFDKRHNQARKTWPFFVDQALHLGLIVLLGRGFTMPTSFALPVWLEQLYFSSPVAVLIVALILVSYAFDIVIYQFKRRHNKKLNYRPDYPGMLQRLSAFALFYFLFLLLFHLIFA